MSASVTPRPASCRVFAPNGTCACQLGHFALPQQGLRACAQLRCQSRRYAAAPLNYAIHVLCAWDIDELVAARGKEFPSTMRAMRVKARCLMYIGQTSEVWRCLSRQSKRRG